MAEKRKHAISFSYELGGQPHRVRLYRSECWPSVEGATEGLYRLKVDRTWVSAGEKYTFFTFSAAMSFVVDLIGKKVGADPLRAPWPPVMPGDPIRAPKRPWLTNIPLDLERTTTSSGPLLGRDGRYYVLVFLYGHGRHLVPLDACEEVSDVDCRH